MTTTYIADNTPVEITSFTLDSTVINLDEGDVLKGSLGFREDVSGFSNGYAQFYSRETDQYISLWLSDSEYDNVDIAYGLEELNEYSPSGTYELQSISISDNAGNDLYMSRWDYGWESFLEESGVVDTSFEVVRNGDNAAPVAPEDSISLNGTEDTAITITSAQLLAGWSDPNSDTLSVTALSTNSSNGTLTPNSNGTWTFTPAANFNGEISFSYTVSDGSLTTDATASVTVAAVNDAPVLTGTTVELPNGTEDVAYVLKASDLLKGYSDIEGDALSITSVTTGSANGSITDNGDGTIGCSGGEVGDGEGVTIAIGIALKQIGCLQDVSNIFCAIG